MINTYNTPRGLFSVYSTDCAFVQAFIKGEAWDTALIDILLKYIPYNGTILDIGGHIGTHAIPYAKERPETQVFTFEPQARIRALLQKNKEQNNAHNLTIIPHGIGHINREVCLANDFTSDGYPPSITVNYDSSTPVNYGGIGITNDPRGEKVIIKTIDSLNFSDVCYMKIDIEGAETLAVYGAQETIKKYKPVLLIEQSDKNVTPTYVNDTPGLHSFNVTEFLVSLGYKFIDLGQSNYLYYHV